MVPDDGNGVADIFLYDAQTDSLERVSLAADGSEANGASKQPQVSNDGRFVSFISSATNLVAGDTNGLDDAFLKDRQTGTVTRLSVTTLGQQADAHITRLELSGDGSTAVFVTTARSLSANTISGVANIIACTVATGQLDVISRSTTGTDPNQPCLNPSVSGDGQRVVFSSQATNLVVGDTNGKEDVFVVSRANPGVAQRISLTYDLKESAGDSTAPRISQDGSFVAFRSVDSLLPSDTNLFADIYLYDLFLSQYEVSSLNLLDLSGGDDCDNPYVSADGRFVLFESRDGNLAGDGGAAGQRHLYVVDRTGGTIQMVSKNSSGTPALGSSYNGLISQDGSRIVYASQATNLVLDDSNNVDDIFRTARAPVAPILIVVPDGFQEDTGVAPVSPGFQVSTPLRSAT